MTDKEDLPKLRGILDSLGYREPLPPDAEPLVNHLLEDLVSHQTVEADQGGPPTNTEG